MTEGRIINKKLEDSTPTVNDPVTYSDSQTLSNTQDHSFYAARIQGKGTSLGNIVFFEATNALGFEGVFSNIRKDRIGTSDIDLPITTGGAAPGSWLATPVNFHNTVTNYFAGLGAPGDSGNFTATSLVSLSSLRFHNTPDTGNTLNSDFGSEGTGAYPSAGADFFAGSPYIHHIGGNEFFVAHNKTPDYNTEVNKLSFPGGVPTKGAVFTAISGVAGFGSASYINSRGSSVVFLGRITSGNHTARINYSSDGGATLEGECDILDAPAGAAVNSNSQFPAAVFLCDDGAAGDRVIVIGTRWNGTNGTQVFLAHTNNPEAGASAQWENLIDLDGFASNNTCILGYRRFGDQLKYSLEL